MAQVFIDAVNTHTHTHTHIIIIIMLHSIFITLAGGENEMQLVPQAAIIFNDEQEKY
jgi:hypothetical protein